MTTNTAAYRTDRIYITGSTYRALAFLCRMDAARAQQEPAGDAVDALVERLLVEHCEKQPQLAARQSAVRIAITKADAPFLAEAKADL